MRNLFFQLAYFLYMPFYRAPERIHLRFKFLYLSLKHHYLLRKVRKLRVQAARLSLIVDRHTGVNQACNFSHFGTSGSREVLTIKVRGARHDD